MAEIVSRNPRTGEEVGRVTAATPGEVAAAVTLGRKAFAEWSALSHAERRPYLKRLKKALIRNADRIADVVAAETGKQAGDALLTEVVTAAALTDYMIRKAPKVLRPERRSSLPFPVARAWLEYHPMGIAGIISPWNYPFSLAFNPAMTALVAGCSAVVKPSEITPLSGDLVADLAREAELPTGLVQVVHGAAETGAALVRDSDIVYFTGSPGTARMVAAEAARSLTPLVLELGGNDAMVVLEDADLRRAARAAVWGGFVNAGQTCIAVERIYVVDEAYDTFLAALGEELTKVHAGGNDAGDIGPITHPSQFAVIERHVADAVAKGATVLAGGHRGEEGFYEPTLLVGVDHTMEVMREESFGPLLPVMRVPNEEAALELANDTRFGLHGSVWTADKERGRRFASRMRTGSVAINDLLINYGMVDLPFGGVDESGYGRHNGPEGLRGFCYQKSVTQRRFPMRRELWWYPRRGGRRLWKVFSRFAGRA